MIKKSEARMLIKKRKGIMCEVDIIKPMRNGKESKRTENFSMHEIYSLMERTVDAVTNYGEVEVIFILRREEASND